MFRGTTAIRRGWLTRAGLRTTAWRKIFRDVYADSSLEVTHWLRSKAVSAYLAPRTSLIAGRSAAHLQGISPFDLSAPIEVLAPRPFGPVDGVTVHQGRAEPADMVMAQGIPVTSPLRTCSDLANWLDETEAVIFVEMFLARRLVTVEQLIAYADARAGQRGATRLRRAARLAEPGSESPQETRLRLALGRAGLPRFAVQQVITHNGDFVARADLSLPELKIAVEYDGGWHATRDQLERDRRRLNRLVTAGWQVIHVTSGRFRDDLDGVVAEIRTAIRIRKRSRS